MYHLMYTHMLMLVPDMGSKSQFVYGNTVKAHDVHTH